MKLLKMRGEKNCDNQVLKLEKRRFRAKIGGKKKELWQLICGNGIAKMERKKNCGN